MYPKTARVYEALVAEFGDDLTDVSISPPSTPATDKTDAKSQKVESEDKALRKQFSLIQKTLDVISKASAESNEETKTLRQALTAKDQELS